MRVIEYSEIPTDLAEALDAEGKLVFGAANICNHYLSVKFLQEVLPSLGNIYHIAEKKIPFYDPISNTRVVPDKVNGLKLEMFIFDIFGLADRWVVMEVLREDEFAPVKNGPGSAVDSPDTARLLVSQQAVRWLEKAGACCEEDKSMSALGLCEVSPLLSYFGEGLEAFEGNVLAQPFFLDKVKEP
jgi:UDP-N-acetylglucosamine/UDP-N-acetylgalactosamine diphosphorylase